MYVTDVSKNEASEDFDWEAFFSPEHADKIIQQVDPLQIIANLRKHLQENKFRLTFTLSKLLRKLLAGEEIKSPKILELGAATGLLTRWLVSQYGGTGVLVDKSEASYKKYREMKDNIKRYLTYITEDIFDLELAEEFDLVCSFGLVEHFVDKRDVLAVHRKFVSSQGIIVILVPLDSPLTRAFLEVHPELNLGYRELLTESEFKKMLTQNGLEVVRTEVSKGYCYDFIGALCRTI
ncbi:MAG: methyltransferase domain-containing protein [Candidatus Aminicenantes bacterium]|nr:methyltransferase domain-containing protein [Candidatus Aminicenantes bacterium]NIM85027.1 methyltransferase domain-containing protein [Candidatus Aminicenantes bacterium]NIN24541.1 methyltransferase domain-containing protein [Candidatus Aminicenantes bacterium]NIN48305.1 methyltransferase domain-containing protein [Candidatus Aminicenantes bacterium]NIN91208.1 methyltransferase domain-containing protein [Candidatus Aminicenantes bacterium]